MTTSNQRRARRRRRELSEVQRPPVNQSIGLFNPQGQRYNSLVASAQILQPTRSLVLNTESWQEEAWNFYDSMGEFTYAENWLASAMSRIRIRAARRTPDSDEPEIIEDGPAAELVQELAGGVGGQSAMLQAFTIQLGVPGDSFLVGYEDKNNNRTWGVYSKDVIDKTSAGVWRLQVEEGQWMTLPKESLVCRVWTPDKRYQYRATSAAKSALTTMREIDLYNRHIISTLVSRLAFNGILFIPAEVTFPTKEEFADAADPFVAELIDIASKSIQNPGNASSAIPIPLKVPAQYIEQFRHLKFADDVNKELGENRDKALIRLAKQLNIPAEVLEGMGSVNHWSAWQIDDSAIKIHLSPIAEVICHGLTVGYLKPSLEVMGEANEEYIIWYDTSELQQKPDLGEKAVQLHDRIAISDAALRRAAQFDESDAPTDEEAKQQIIKKLAYNGQQATNAWELLTGTPAPSPPSSASPSAPGDANAAPDGNLPPSGGGGAGQTPDTSGDAPNGGSGA